MEKTAKKRRENQLRRRKWNWLVCTLRSDVSVVKQALPWILQSQRRKRMTKEQLEKRSGERTVDSRFEVQVLQWTLQDHRGRGSGKRTVDSGFEVQLQGQRWQLKRQLDDLHSALGVARHKSDISYQGHRFKVMVD